MVTLKFSEGVIPRDTTAPDGRVETTRNNRGSLEVLRPVQFGVLDVTLCIAVDRLKVGCGGLTANFARLAHHHAARRNFHALRNQRARGNDAALADFGTVENDAAHADQASRADGAAVQDHVMTY